MGSTGIQHGYARTLTFDQWMTERARQMNAPRYPDPDPESRYVDLNPSEWTEIDETGASPVRPRQDSIISPVGGPFGGQ